MRTHPSASCCATAKSPRSASVVCDDIIEDRTDFFHVGAGSLAIFLPRLGVGENGGKRLRQFMREGAGELSELRTVWKGVQARYVRRRASLSSLRPCWSGRRARRSSAFAPPSQECRADGHAVTLPGAWPRSPRFLRRRVSEHRRSPMLDCAPIDGPAPHVRGGLGRRMITA